MDLTTDEGNNWDIAFSTEDEIESALDAVIETLGETFLEEDKKTAILRMDRIKQMQFSFALLKYLLKDTDAEIRYKLHSPYKSVGSIIIKAKSILFTDAKWFASAAAPASNMDVYPLTDGRITMALTFHGITEPIE